MDKRTCDPILDPCVAVVYRTQTMSWLCNETLISTHCLKKTSMYFPNRLELSFRIVLALPKDSSRGLASRICSVMRLLPDLLTAARYCMINLVASVFPDPDSPLKHKNIPITLHYVFGVKKPCHDKQDLQQCFIGRECFTSNHPTIEKFLRVN